jgi:hypothetical protein
MGSVGDCDIDKPIDEEEEFVEEEVEFEDGEGDNDARDESGGLGLIPSNTFSLLSFSDCIVPRSRGT